MERKDLKPLIEIARLNSDKELLLRKYHEIADENLRLKQELIDIKKGKIRSYQSIASDSLKILLPVLFLYLSFIFARYEKIIEAIHTVLIDIVIFAALFMLLGLILFFSYLVIKSIRKE